MGRGVTSRAALVPALVVVAGCGGTAHPGVRTVVRERTQTRTVTVAAASAPAAVSSPNVAAPAGVQVERRFIAQLGSFRSREEAARFAAGLRARGVPAAVIRSDAYRELRAGYWVAYEGFFDGLRAAGAAARQAAAAGAAGAFARRVTYDFAR